MVKHIGKTNKIKGSIMDINSEVASSRYNREVRQIMLVQKFERDIAKRSRLVRFLLVFDQMVNVLFWNGSQDETVSSHIGRRIVNGTSTWFDRAVCRVLQKLDNNHCNKSIGE
jgi:hypothetical protein